MAADERSNKWDVKKRMKNSYPEIKYVMSERGTPQLTIDGFRFTRKRRSKTTIQWVCIQNKCFKCTARATTNSKGMVEQLSNNHNHTPQLRRHYLQSGPSVVHYHVSKRGSFQLEIDGYRFTRMKILQSTIHWICLQTKALHCKARAVTNNDPEGTIRRCYNFHNHPPTMRRRQHGDLQRIREDRMNDRR
ncbi:FLYWCH-type zinc finger-containing protein 1 [Armigeres subalbatus]|uniref:FLYWCH-type zinc finger-containing protein 1 n=1 Tax=Armigeres subalbatus TaxID=124917 RepID=UPI002ED3480C